MKTKATKKRRPVRKPLKSGDKPGGAGLNHEAVASSTLESSAEKNSALPLEGWNPFRGIPLKDGCAQIHDRIRYLIFLATDKRIETMPRGPEIRETASRALADIGGLFIQAMPPWKYLTPDIRALDGDKKSGFSRRRQEWKSTKETRPFIDDFARSIFEIVSLDSDIHLTGDEALDWKNIYEPQCRKYWPSWTSIQTLARYRPNMGKRLAQRVDNDVERLAWAKGKWGEDVRTALKVIQQRALGGN